MKHKVLSLAGALLFALCSGHPVQAQGAAGKPVVAVLPFASPSQWSAMGRNAEATFITQLVQTGKLRVIQASMVAQMLRRHGLRFTGAVDPALLKAAKRWLQASYVLTGKLRWTGDAYTLSTHVMDVNTLETTMADDVDFSDQGKMRIAVRLAARKIAGRVTGTAVASGNADLFVKVSARAFYDTADACLSELKTVLSGYHFEGTVEESDGKRVRLNGQADQLKPGIPIDIYGSNDALDGPRRRFSVYYVRSGDLGVQARARFAPDDGFTIGARASTDKHSWIVAVGRIVDEASDDEQLVKRFRSALLEKMSRGTDLQQIEGRSTDNLASMSNRTRRFFAYRKLFDRGIEAVLDGKLYGSAGRRRADIQIYSTMTGKLLGQLQFETRL